MKDRQTGNLAWAIETFGPIAADKVERGTRLAEEALEAAHAAGVNLETIARLAERVYSRPAGDIAKEIGQVGVTLEQLAEVFHVHAEFEIARETHRIMSVPKEEWERRHAAKVALGIAS